MKKFTAVFGKHNGRIISVGAETKEEARKEVHRQLARPGRHDAHNRWKQDGEQLIVSEF